MTCCGSGLPLPHQTIGRPDANSGAGARELTTFQIPAMHCANCMNKLESGMLALDGVQHARANLSVRQLEVIHSGGGAARDTIGDAISGLGFDWHFLDDEDAPDDVLAEQGRSLLLCLAIAGFASANIMLLSVSVWSGASAETAKLFGLLSGLIAVPAIFFAGRPFFSSAMRALSARQVNMDVPISLAVLLSLFMSLYEAMIGGGETFFDAGVMLLFFLLIGRYLDHMMRQRAASGVASLAKLMPRAVLRVEVGGDTVSVPLESVAPGERLRLHSGERFPVDAIILSGASTVDRSIVTGETGEIPVREGQTLEAGTVNLSGILEIEAISDARTSFISEVMEMMKAAETSKGRYRRIADRMAAIYAPAVHLLALVTLLAWLVFGADFKDALVAAIAVLIITCPCALGLAVPVTHVVAANRLFAAGIMMRDGSALERLSEVETVFFDKTGTLTDEALRLKTEVALGEKASAALHTLAQQSLHPVARTVATALTEQATAELVNFTEVPGMGVEALWNDKRVRFGRTEWVSELSSTAFAPEAPSTAFAIEGGEDLALDFASDLKPGTRAAVKELLSQGLDATILSGDRESQVATVARSLGIANWRSRLTPRAKIETIEEAAKSAKALMVGDGLNDAPALAAAHASMAPADAIDVSRASADFVFTRPSLEAVPFALRLSRAAGRVVRQNFGIAIVYNCIAVPLAMAGYVTPLIAALAMSLSSIVVVANSMRLAGFGRRQTRGDFAANPSSDAKPVPT